MLTYTPCKFSVKPELHTAAFPYYAGCRIVSAMGSKHTYLREWRKYRGMTQDQVVDRLAVLEDPNIPSTAASLSRLENGKQPYGQRVLEALAAIYDCEPDELLGHDPFKEGRVIDFVRHLDERKQAQALAILRALSEEGDGTNG